MFGKFISGFMEKAVVVKETSVFYKWKMGVQKFWILVKSGTKSSFIINTRALYKNEKENMRKMNYIVVNISF